LTLLQNKLDRKVTPTHLKQHNEALILREIYAHESISRVNLAKLTHLSRPSVTELTQGLIEKGLIAELGPENVFDKVGKKPTLLAINPDAYQMVGIVLNNTSITASLLDLRMHIVGQERVALNDITSDALVALMIDVVERTLRQATRPVLGLSVGTPGIVNSDEGVIHLAANFAWHDLPLARILTDRFQLPAYIGNDCNYAAIGVQRFGAAQGVDNLMVVEIGDGIGVGILADGRMVQGSRHAAGELGHTPFMPLEDPCICGQKGCLETLVTWWGMKRHARQFIQDYPDSILARLAQNHEITSTILCEAYAQGDPQVIALVMRAATYLGRALVVAINLLNPQYIILTGSLLTFGDSFVDRVRTTIKQNTLPYITSQIEIVANGLDDRSILFGAGAFLLERELGL